MKDKGMWIFNCLVAVFIVWLLTSSYRDDVHERGNRLAEELRVQRAMCELHELKK